MPHAVFGNKALFVEPDHGLLILWRTSGTRVEMNGIFGSVFYETFFFQDAPHIAGLVMSKVFGDVQAVNDEARRCLHKILIAE